MNSNRLKPFLLGLSALIFLLVGSARAQTELNTNLLVNGDAEATSGSTDETAVVAPVPWVVTGNFTAVQYAAEFSDLKPGDSTRIDGGNNYFAGGPDNAESSAAQVITFSSDRFADIDAGNLTAVLSAFIGGYREQGDNIIITAEFRDAGGLPVTNFHLGPIDARERQSTTQLVPRTKRLIVPAGARSVQVTIAAKRDVGSYNDGYADNVSFKLIQTPADAPSYFGNLSTRLKVGVNDSVAIGGFIARGTPNEHVIVRAIGPSLLQANPPVPNALLDPTIELRTGNGTLIKSNDDWASGDQTAEITASGLAPSNPKEAAVAADLPAGNYTAIVRGANETTGIGLVEVYTTDTPVVTRNLNISTRGRTEPGDEVMIAGFIIQGENPKQVVIRGIGPSLQDAHPAIADTISNPVLELHDAEGRLIEQNDNWREAQNNGDLQEVGLEPQQDNESAILITLEPGNYTAILRSAGNEETGNALVEVYDLDPSNAAK